MQTTLETLGAARTPAERRGAARGHRRRGEEAADAARAHRQGAGLPARQGADARCSTQQYGPQVRSDVISERVQASFNDAIREQNLRVAGTPRIEPQQREQPRRRCARVLGRLRGLSRSAGRRRQRDRDRRGRVAEVTPQDVDARSTCCAGSARRIAGGAGGRSTAIACASTSPARSTASSSPAARRRDFAIVLGEGRMLPEFEAARHRHEGRRDASRSTLTFPADYHGTEVAGKDGAVHADGRSGRGAARAGARRRIRARRSASRAAASTTCARKSRRT